MATFSDIVQSLRLEMDARSVKDATDIINKNTKANENNASAIEASARATTNFQKSGSRAADELHRIRMQTEPAYAAFIKLQKAVSALNKIDPQARTPEHIALVEKLAEKVRKAEGAVNDNAAAFNRLASSIQKASKIAEGMSLFGSRTDSTNMTGRLSTFIKEDGARAVKEAERIGKEISAKLSAGMADFGGKTDTSGMTGKLSAFIKLQKEQTAKEAEQAGKEIAKKLLDGMSSFGGKTDLSGMTAKLSTFLKAQKEQIAKEAEQAGKEVSSRLLAGMTSFGGKTDLTGMTSKLTAFLAVQREQIAKEAEEAGRAVNKKLLEGLSSFGGRTDLTGMTAVLSAFLKEQAQQLAKEAEESARRINAALIAGLTSAGGKADMTGMTAKLTAFLKEQTAILAREAEEAGKAISEKLLAGMSNFGGKTDRTVMTAKLSAFLKEQTAQLAKEAEEIGRAINAKLVSGLSASGNRTDKFEIGLKMGAVGKARAEQEAAAREAATAARISGMTALMSGTGGRDGIGSTMGAFAVTDAIKRDTAAKEANIAANKRLVDGLGAIGKKSIESAEFIRKMTASTTANTAAVTQNVGGLTKLQKLTVQQTFGDVISSLSTGQSPQTILLQQGEQFLQPFGTGMEGVKNAAKTLGPILMRLVFNPITLIGTAALTTAYAMDKWKESQDAVAVSLNGLARQAGLTLNQINAIAAATSNTSTISNSTARTYATMFAGAGVSGAAIQPGLGLVDPLSRRLGVDQGEMAQTLAGALSAPGKGAEELARKFGLLTYAEQEQIKRLGETGEKTKATAKLIELLGGKIEEMDDPTTRFAAALEQAKKGFLNFIDSIGREAKQLYSPDSFDTVKSRIIRGQQSQKDAEASAAAARLADLTKEYSPEYADQQARNRQFQQITKDLNNSRAMVMLDKDGAKAAESVEKFAAKMRALQETETDLTKRQSDANARSLSTYSEQIKAKTRADQEYTTEVRKSGDEALANAKKHAVLKESLAQSSFALQNAVRTAQDNLKMAGMTGLQRQKYQAFMEGRTLRETYGSDGGVQALMERAADTAFNKQTFTDPLSKLVDQQGVLGAQEKTLGMPLNEATAYVEQVRLTNEVMREQGFVTDEQRVKIQTLAEAMGEAAQAQEDFASKQRNLADAMDIVRSTTHDIGTSLAEAFRRGEDAGKALLNVLDRLASKLLDKTLDMAIDGLFGKMGGTSGGAFGSIIGGIGKMFSFADGGVMTSSGAVPLMAYANGGVANRPQMALFGEGSTPEAFVPVPSGKIPVEMRGQKQQRPQIVINNNASGLVDLQAREDQLTGRILVTVNSMIGSSMKKVPGIVADAQRRSL